MTPNESRQVIELRLIKRLKYVIVFFSFIVSCLRLAMTKFKQVKNIFIDLSFFLSFSLQIFIIEKKIFFETMQFPNFRAFKRKKLKNIENLGKKFNGKLKFKIRAFKVETVDKIGYCLRIFQRN